MPTPDSLADAGLHLAAIWRSLIDAAGSRDSPLRTPNLSTIGPEGSPQSRTVVLRLADDRRRELFIYTDVRSPKVAELRRDPRTSVVFYDPGEQTQIRIDGIATVHHDDATAHEHWPRVPESNQANYRTVSPPGSPIASPDAIAHAGDGADHFAVIVVRVAQMEWLWLDRAGHKRCAFTFDEAGTPTRQWLVP